MPAKEADHAFDHLQFRDVAVQIQTVDALGLENDVLIEDVLDGECYAHSRLRRT